jgi:pSer/pThr/pTyr-binding forkhead associated (FHA) protein
VVRTGGGRAGEIFRPQGERTRIGRSPDCEIFLDDVTVSRNHAVLVERDGTFAVEDQGSLNGTFVNRRRIDSVRLENGDEVQIGKYRMTFVER